MKNVLEPRAHEVLRLYDDGMKSPTELAPIFGCSVSGMRSFLCKYKRDTSRKFADRCKDLSSCDAAYLAGLIDGEGCLFARKVKSRNTVGVQSGLAIAMTCRHILEQMQELTGIGSVILSPSSKNQPRGWKDCWRWDVGAQSVAMLIPKILPFLRIKRTQAELIIELAEIKRLSVPCRQNNIDRQFEIVEEMQRLNKRGA